MSTTNTKLAGSDIGRKSFLSVLMHEINTYEYRYESEDDGVCFVSLDELKTAVTDPFLLFETVREALSDNNEIGQSLAHLKVKARQKTEFTKGGAHFFAHVDVMFFDVQLIDALGFNERERAIIYYELIQSYGRWITSEEYEKYNQVPCEIAKSILDVEVRHPDKELAEVSA